MLDLTYVFRSKLNYCNTPYSKMAATQDGLGRVARKRSIEGQGSQEILRGNHREMDRRIANSAKKKHQNSEYHSLPTGLRKAKAFLVDEYLHEIREEPYNLKLALCIVSGEVEYAYCGPSCTAGKSGFCNHILALMCPLV